jgi:putative redox protein
MSNPNSAKVYKAPDGKLQQIIEVGRHRWIADEPPDVGGDDAGPSPFDMLDAALGACTALTVTMVANRKQMPLKDVRVDVAHTQADGVYRMQRRIDLVGQLSEEQRQYLLGIANKCPVHRTLTGKIEIETSLTPPSS